MGMEQETLIYVEENDKEEAKVLTQGLLNKNVKSRAYINALGAELALKYLALENINNSKTYNMHNVHKILEEFDISDIMLSNIHIDVRVVFDENKIFIPKSHFEYNITPDIYLVFLLAEDSSHVKFLGFFEPKLINKNNQNADYYFIEKEKLTSPLNLKAYVDAFKGNRTQSLSDEVNSTAEMLMVSVVDQNASKEEMKELLKYLTQSSALRDRFIEFENFEILSYKAERSPDVTLPEEVAQNNIIDATIDDLKSEPENVVSGSVDEVVKSVDNTEVLPSDEMPDTMITSETIENISESALNTEIGVNDNLDLSDLPLGDLDMSLNGEEGLTSESVLPAVENLSSDDISENSDTDNPDDVTAMFTNSSMADTAEILDFQESGLESANLEPAESSGVEELSSSQNMENIENENSASPDVSAQAEDVSHDFEVGNADDFFADMTPENTQIDSGNNLNNAEDFSENNAFETVDFNSMDQTFVPKPDDLPAEDEMEVLDISNVNAVPNDLDKNISETIEFNNIELSSEEPCFNQVNGEQTVPMLNMNDFSPLEPLPMEEVKAESYDMDSLSITDNMYPMPNLNTNEKSLELVGMADLEPLEAPALEESPSEAAKVEDSLDDVNSELDAIPDFNSDDMDLGLSSSIEEDVAGNTDFESSLSETHANSSLEDIQNLTVDDIVEQPMNDFAQDEVPVTDMETLAQVDELENVQTESEAIPSIENFSDDDVPDIDDISTLQNDMESSDIQDGSPNVEQGNELDSQDIAADENSDLSMLFDENQSEDEPQPESFETLNSGMANIPSIYQQTQKLPVKMIAVAAVAAMLVVGGVVGVSMKNKNSASESEPLAQSVPENPLPAAPVADNTDILANTPEVQTLPAPQKEPVNVKKEADNTKSSASAKPVNPQGQLLSVSKLSWEVPDYLSYSDNIKKYLQTAGKSIKLTLSSDLLLVSQYAYSNQMKVDLKLSSDGTLRDSKVVKSSGSEQIDNIVLQTVKDTLNVIKPATGEVPTPDFHLALIINF